MRIEKTFGFKTSDSTIHASKLEAVKHQASIEIKSILRNGTHINGGSINLTSDQIAEIILKNTTKIAEIGKEIKDAVRRAERSQLKKSRIKVSAPSPRVARKIKT